MKICYIADGLSIHVTEWANYFQKIGHDVTIISDTNCHINDTKVYNIGDCLRKIRIPVLSAFIQIHIKIKKIKKILKAIRPDVIHAHYATNYGFLAAKTGFHPFFLTCHGSDILVDPFKDKINRYFVLTALKTADIITLPSDEMEKKVIEAGFPKEKIKQIQYGIELCKFKYSTQRDKIINILSTRYLEKKYRIDLIIKASSEVVKTFPNIRFNILGDGTDKILLKQMIVRLELEQKVEMPGWINHSLISAYYTKSQIYVTTSPTDGISISLLEAFASGCYPVIPDNPSNRLIQSQGFYVKLFKVNDSRSLADGIIKVIKQLLHLQPALEHNYDLVSQLYSRDINLNIINDLYKNAKTN